MPDDTQIDAPTVATRTITSDDIEPPTEITDPKLKKKMKKPMQSGGGDSSSFSSEVSDDGDDEEERGRPRGIEEELGMKKDNQEGLPGNQNYIFLGDFVDRGYFSLETFTLLMCLKAKYAPAPTSSHRPLANHSHQIPRPRHPRPGQPRIPSDHPGIWLLRGMPAKIRQRLRLESLLPSIRFPHPSRRHRR